MKVIKITLGGKELHLLFSGAAMFAIREKQEDLSKLIEKTLEDSVESFDLACELVSIMAESGELARRYMGYSPEDILDADTIKRIVQPYDIFAIKTAIPKAVALGFGRDVTTDDDEEVDLVLLELNQKKTT